MKRRGLARPLRESAFAAFVLLLAASRGSAAPSAALYTRCARACQACAAACRACDAHCSEMVKSGMKQYSHSAGLSADCGEICALAGKICARKGPLAVELCKACQRACAACGAECSKHKDMAPMAACARSCAACGKACADMVAAGK